MINTFTKAVRTHLVGRDARFLFKKTEKPEKQGIDLRTNLYIHIPFCKNLCPYCPYNKIEYEKNTAKSYLAAILNEIRMLYQLFGTFEISSVYIGGGSPVLFIDELNIIFQEIDKRFKLSGNICIEISPNEINKTTLGKLKSNNIDLVSIGVQSFQDKYLEFIGRKYRSSILNKAVGETLESGFKSVNIDLMFALPGQKIGDVTDDLQAAVETGVHQITTYPLFTFPYSAIGKYLRLKKVKMPKMLTRRRLYYHIHQYLTDREFKRVSVWGFKRGHFPRYSSVTRDNYIGLGAGAGSHMRDGFYLNTFSVEEYIRACLSNKFPTALFMNFDESMQNYFWLYWRLYDTVIPKEDLWGKFEKNDRRINQIFNLFKILGLTHENEQYFELTKKGAFWVHLLQNYFSLNYINKIWGVAMKEAYPEEIEI